MDNEYNNRCGDCTWFDPAYDHCYFIGAARVEDLAFEDFKLAE